MNLPIVTVQQVVAELGRMSDDAARIGAHRALAMRADPTWSGPPTVLLGDVDVPVVTARSPIEIHSALAAHDGQPLVLLTSCQNSELPLDVRARLVEGRVRTFDLFSTLLTMFSADVIDPALAKLRELCELLVQVAPAIGYPVAPDRLLDLATGWRAFDRWCFGTEIGESPADVLRSFAGSLHPSQQALKELPAPLIASLVDRWAATGLPTNSLIGLASQGNGRTIVPLGLAYDVVVGIPPSPELASMQRETTIRLESAVPTPPPTAEQRRAWANASLDLIRSSAATQSDAPLVDAEAMLSERNAAALCIVSDVLPTGFTQRLAAAGHAILTGTTEDRRLAIASLRSHVLAGRNADRLARVEMACRLAERRAPAISGVGLAIVANDYLADGRWFDQAREILFLGDAVPELATAYTSLLQSAETDRAKQNESFAGALAEWSRGEPLPGSLIPIEQVLDRVVVPLAEHAPVLVVVMDGLSHPAALELMTSLETRRWHLVAPPGGRASETVVAMLPTVTEVSRASLLCGERVVGDLKREAQGFAAHPGLKAASKGGSSPRLFHKSDLIGPDGAALGKVVSDTIHDYRQRIVAVVVNAVDDHLGSGDQIHVNWSATSIRPLGWVLDAAEASGRLVVLVADHGHVLERGGAPRSVTGDQGERWHSAPGPVPSGEIEITGPRVLKGNGRVVLPYVEDRRFNNTRKRGYHGGATPQEVLAPCLILAHAQHLPNDFEYGWLAPPAWWSGEASPTAVAPARPPRTSAGKPKPAIAGEQSLFGAGDAAGNPAPAADWVTQMLASPLLVDSLQRSLRQRLDPEHLATLLRSLGNAGGRLDRRSLAARLQVQEFRLNGLLSAARQVVNVDGYGILTDSGDTVELNLALVREQFKVGPT